MSESFSSGRNDVRLLTRLDGEDVSHFRLREFENRDGLAMIHSSTLNSLELVRRDLNAMAGEEVWVIVTDALRTQADLDRLASLLGCTDDGGAVSRDSKHLAKHWHQQLVKLRQPHVTVAGDVSADDVDDAVRRPQHDRDQPIPEKQYERTDPTRR